MRSAVLIDGNYFLWRSFSVPFKFFSDNGTPLHVLTMYLKHLRNIRDEIRKQSDEVHMAVVFDTNQAADDGTILSGNKDLLEDYKANRKMDFSKEEDSPFRHLDNIKTMFDNELLPYLEVPGFEADDVIASLSSQIDKSEYFDKVFIASNDSDFYQLLSPTVNQIILKKERIIADHLWVERTVGITPQQYVLWKSLVGDSSDNIPGVDGIGPKRATQYIQGIYDIDIAAHQDILDRNRQLITLQQNLSVEHPTPWENHHNVFSIPNYELFSQCGF